MFDTLKIRLKAFGIFFLMWVACAAICAVMWGGISLAIMLRPVTVQECVPLGVFMGFLIGTMWWTFSTAPSIEALQAEPILPRWLRKFKLPFLWLVAVLATSSMDRSQSGIITESGFMLGTLLFVIGGAIFWMRNSVARDRKSNRDRQEIAKHLRARVEAFIAGRNPNGEPAPDSFEYSLIEEIRKALEGMSAPGSVWTIRLANYYRPRLSLLISTYQKMGLSAYERVLKDTYDLSAPYCDLDEMRRRIVA